LIGATITDGDTGGSDFDVDTAFVRLREVMPQYPPAAMFQLAAEAMCMCIGWSTAGTSPPPKKRRKRWPPSCHQAIGSKPINCCCRLAKISVKISQNAVAAR
jgi:hypothetical protein